MKFERCLDDNSENIVMIHSMVPFLNVSLSFSNDLLTFLKSRRADRNNAEAPLSPLEEFPNEAADARCSG